MIGCHYDCTCTLEAIEAQRVKTLLDCGDFEQLYATSIKSPDIFWGTLAKQFLQWEKLFTTAMDCDMKEGVIKWFSEGKLNVSGNNNC